VDYGADWLPVRAAARLVNVSPQTVYNYVKRNEIRQKNRGGRTLVATEDVRRMAAQKFARFPAPASQTPTPVREPEEEETVSTEPVTLTATTGPHRAELVPFPAPAAAPASAADRLTVARMKIDHERGELAEARRSREEQIERLRGELELLLVRESELDDAIKAIETIERLGV
jgi:hypothetical protein